jgi:hypothetical protein
MQIDEVQFTPKTKKRKRTDTTSKQIAPTQKASDIVPLDVNDTATNDAMELMNEDLLASPTAAGAASTNSPLDGDFGSCDDLLIPSLDVDEAMELAQED